MRIGARTTIFNVAMRERRKELGMTQAQLAELCHVSPSTIGSVELLHKPSVRAEMIPALLDSISDYLGVPFSDLFPDDYIAALESELLKYRPRGWLIERSIDLATLLPDTQGGGILAIEDKIQKEELARDLQRMVEGLPPREMRVMQLHYGLLDGEGYSWEEIGRKMGFSRERIRQIISQALSRLRENPRHSKALREYLPSSHE
jgi:transcriptional regulator with XRE-family HTH domain